MLRATQRAVLLLLSLTSLPVFGAEGEGVAPAAAKLIDFGGGWAITNSMATGWAVSLLLVAFVMWLVGKPSVMPSKGQALVEKLIEALRDLFEPIVGKKAFPAAFPILVTLFIFILFHNWMGLLPGVGTMGWGRGEHWWSLQHIDTPWIRPHNADFNGTIALALISFGAWAIIVLKYVGPRLILFDLFGNKADKKETPAWLYPILSIVFLLVGFIEVFSIAIRPFTLSVRLFGNIFGGENLLHGTGFFFVFYFMELLVGLIQALVFTLLTSVYIGLLANHGDDHDHEHAADEKSGHVPAAPH
ncbi:ATP synthase F0, A subunit [Opitutus terrae PB90-1]|uniref:ATP synthase subunit a n=2 Tax=Opitutus terrae TaxID=107709 RepID=B1ZWP2_OPITP|nr:ATP synthase F0, A subunit [Opitutus terrae PB90-1]